MNNRNANGHRTCILKHGHEVTRPGGYKICFILNSTGPESPNHKC